MSGELSHSLDRSQEPPRRLGRYRIVGELGRGGVGLVYKAAHPDLGREVAVKVLAAELACVPLQRERFQVEVRTTARLRHPNIVTIHDVGEQDGCPYFVMDLVQGGSLADKLEAGGPLPVDEAVEITTRIARALAYAHGQSILHRDIKPDNVLLTTEGVPVLTDFGLARDTAAARRLTVDSSMVGTPIYMSPEQVAGEDHVDRRSDLYSLGATFYELLVGEHPPPAYMEEPPVPPSRRRQGLDADLDAICLTCLAREPERRYASATALAEDLERYARGESIEASTPGVLYHFARWRQRNRGLTRGILSGLSALVLSAAGLIAWTTHTNAQAALRRLDARREADEEARARAARGFSEQTHAALQLLASAPDGDDEASLDRRTGRALAALQAARAWRAVDPSDLAAAKAQFQAATSLGKVAQRSEQWALASQAYGQATTLGVDDDAAAAARDGVLAIRNAEANARREAVTEVLVAATRGALARRPDGLEEAVYTLVGFHDAQTVSLLGSVLEDACERLREAEALVYEEAGVPDADERAAGARTIDGLRGALSARAHGDAAPEQVAALRGAEQRLLRRARRSSRRSSRAPSVSVLVARRQRDHATQGLLDAAWVACESLGHMGLARGAVAPLVDYLRAERDPSRALPAAIALCRLGDRESTQHVRAARRRFGEAFARRLDRARVLIALRDGR